MPVSSSSKPNSKKKFSTKISESVLDDLYEYASESKLPISEIVTTAVAEHLRLVQIRPAFREMADKIIVEHDKLLAELALR